MAKRIDKIQNYLNTHEMDALLIRSKTMKKWLSTMTGGGCTVLVTKKQGYLILDGRYLTEAREKEHDLTIELIEPYKGKSTCNEVVKEILDRNNCEVLGVEADATSVKEYDKLQTLKVKIVMLDEEIPEMRMIKDDEEIAAVQKAIDITDEIYEKVIHQLRVGMSEYEINALLQYYSFSAGAQQMSFDTIVSTGERTALPHGRPTDRKLKAHEPVMMDFGIQYRNYQSDMTRMCFLGEPTDEMRKIYDTALQAQLAGLEAIKKGAVASDVDKAARDVITAAGYGEYFGHGLGHGIGIGDGNEYPILNPKSRMILDNNMMMSCEPGIYVPGVGGVRIEDDVVIRYGIGIPMNRTDKHLRVLEIQ